MQSAGTFQQVVKLLILTGQRRSEIASLRPSYIAPDQTCILPATLPKNSREHQFPLNALAVELLSQALKHAPATDSIFPARGNAATSFNGWSKSKAALDKLSGVSSWTLPDFRRTYCTKLAELGLAPHIGRSARQPATDTRWIEGFHQARRCSSAAKSRDFATR